MVAMQATVAAIYMYIFQKIITNKSSSSYVYVLLVVCSNITCLHFIIKNYDYF